MALPIAPQRLLALETLAEIAGDGMRERMRREAAARIIVAARRARALLGRRARAAATEVERLAEAWDPSTLTALEYAEGLSAPQLDGLLGEAPRWAREARRHLAEAGAAA